MGIALAFDRVEKLCISPSLLIKIWLDLPMIQLRRYLPFVFLIATLTGTNAVLANVVYDLETLCSTPISAPSCTGGSTITARFKFSSLQANYTATDLVRIDWQIPGLGAFLLVPAITTSLAFNPAVPSFQIDFLLDALTQGSTAMDAGAGFTSFLTQGALIQFETTGLSATLRSVPEPATLGLLGRGLAGLGFNRQKKA